MPAQWLAVLLLLELCGEHQVISTLGCKSPLATPLFAYLPITQCWDKKIWLWISLCILGADPQMRIKKALKRSSRLRTNTLDGLDSFLACCWPLFLHIVVWIWPRTRPWHWPWATPTSSSRCQAPTAVPHPPAFQWLCAVVQGYTWRYFKAINFWCLCPFGSSTHFSMHQLKFVGEDFTETHHYIDNVKTNNMYII